MFSFLTEVIIYYIVLGRFRTVSCQPLQKFTTHLHTHKCVFHNFPDFIIILKFYVTINKRFEDNIFVYLMSFVQFFGDILLGFSRQWNPDLSYRRVKHTVVFSRRYRIQNAYGARDCHRHFHIDEHHYRHADNGPDETQPFVVELKHNPFITRLAFAAITLNSVPGVVHTLYDGLQPRGLK